MISRSIVLFMALFLPFWIQAQNLIEVHYNEASQGIDITPDLKDIKAGDKYQLKILHINPVYIQDHIRIRSFRYLSPTPEILEPILPGIPGSNVFDHFDIKPGGQREFFLKALQFFNELELLRSESDDLYLKTRLDPNPNLAAEKLTRIDTIFETSDLQDLVTKIVYYQDYILASESVYKTNIKKVTLLTPDADIVLREYARLTRLADKIRQIDYTQMLDFIVRSTHTRDFILSDVFTAEKDLIEIKVALYDQYIHDSLYSGTLTYHTESNWSFDFSTGLMYTTLYDRDYYLLDREDGMSQVKNEKKFKGDISIGALTHYTYKIKPNLRIGPALGASISPFDGNIRYLAGGSAFAGSKRIVGISAGISLGNVEVLSGAIRHDGQGAYLPAGEKKIPTYTRTKAGFFFSLTYNFTRTKKP